MTKLYSKLAHVYHEMYQSIFDYRAEFRQGDSILKKHMCHRILELGCGSGNLAPYFLNAGYDYVGMDIAKAMLKIARSEVASARFVHGDMRRFSFARKFDAVLIGGRSFTYMTTNDEVRCALECISNVLKPGGILIFDNFDAEFIFTNLPRQTEENIESTGTRFVRRSETFANFKHGWTWNWNAVYVVDNGKTKRTTFYDRSVLRAFTRDELRLFLTLAGFTPIASRRRSASILFVAKRVAKTVRGQRV